MILPSRFDNPEEVFSCKELQFKTSCYENVNETPRNAAENTKWL